MRLPFLSDPRQRARERLQSRIADLQTQIGGLEQARARPAPEEQAASTYDAVQRVRASLAEQELAAKRAELARLTAELHEIEASLAASEPPPVEQPGGGPSARPRGRLLVLGLGIALVVGLAASAALAAGRLGPSGGQVPAPPPASPTLIVASPTPPPPTATEVPTSTPIPPTITPIPEPTVAAVEAEPELEPEPESGPEPAIGTGRVQAPGFSGANLHVDPSVSARVIRTLSNGTAVDILPGSATADGFRWARVRTVQGEVGWMVAGAVVGG